MKKNLFKRIRSSFSSSLGLSALLLGATIGQSAMAYEAGRQDRTQTDFRLSPTCWAAPNIDDSTNGGTTFGTGLHSATLAMFVATPGEGDGFRVGQAGVTGWGGSVGFGVFIDGVEIIGAHDFSNPITEDLLFDCGFTDISGLSQKGADHTALSYLNDTSGQHLEFTGTYIDGEEYAGYRFHYRGDIHSDSTTSASFTNLGDVTSPEVTLSGTGVSVFSNDDASGVGFLTLTEGEEVTLSAVITDNSEGHNEGDTTYEWTGTTPDAAALLSNTTSSETQTFSLPSVPEGSTEIDLPFQLTATDPSGHDTTATLIITVEATIPPVAEAGSSFDVTSGQENVSLDGSGSTEENVTYEWTTTNANVIINESTTLNPTFDAPVLLSTDESLDIEFTLTVTDDATSASVSDTVSVTVLAPETVPLVAEAGSSFDVTSGQENVPLDGSGSTEENVTYEWTTTNANVIINDSTTLNPTFDAPVLLSTDENRVIEFTLTVTDDATSASVSDTVSVIVLAPENVFDGPTAEELQTEITGFIQARASHVISAQQDLVGFLNGENSTGNRSATLIADGSQANLNFNFKSSGNQAIWQSLQGSWSSSEGKENGYLLGAFGSHVNLTPDSIVGVMLQYDHLTQEDDQTSTEGTGYLVGPYFVAQVPDSPLFFEGRFLMGQTENTTSIDGAAEQEFDTNRSLLALKVYGQQLRYENFTITPSLSATHLRETQTAFTDNNGIDIAEQGVSRTDLSVGLDFFRPIQVNSGALTWSGGVSGNLFLSGADGFASTIITDSVGLGGSIHTGMNYALDNGLTLNGNISYGGSALDDISSRIWGAKFDVSFEF